MMREGSKITLRFLSSRITCATKPFIETGKIGKEPFWSAVGDINEFIVRTFEISKRILSRQLDKDFCS